MEQTPPATPEPTAEGPHPCWKLGQHTGKEGSRQSLGCPAPVPLPATPEPTPLLLCQDPGAAGTGTPQQALSEGSAGHVIGFPRIGREAKNLTGKISTFIYDFQNHPCVSAKIRNSWFILLPFSSVNLRFVLQSFSISCSCPSIILTLNLSCGIFTFLIFG